MSRGSTSSKIIEQKEIEESRLSIYLACSVAPPPRHTPLSVPGSLSDQRQAMQFCPQSLSLTSTL